MAKSSLRTLGGWCTEAPPAQCEVCYRFR